jgi:very-short-patch-repair endonuclease
MHASAKPELFQFAKKLRLNMTEAELKLWQFLKKKPNNYKFRRQHPFGKYILDFYCHRAKLVIELDGKYHEFYEQKKMDDIRTKEIESTGLMEIRFTNEEVLNNFNKVKYCILNYLD